MTKHEALIRDADRNRAAASDRAWKATPRYRAQRQAAAERCEETEAELTRWAEALA